LITKLLSDKNKRLGINGINEIKAHPFFNGLDWNNLRKETPPFIP
jgi:serine/threonine kinase 38